MLVIRCLLSRDTLSALCPVGMRVAGSSRPVVAGVAAPRDLATTAAVVMAAARVYSGRHGPGFWAGPWSCAPVDPVAVDLLLRRLSARSAARRAGLAVRPLLTTTRPWAANRPRFVTPVAAAGIFSTLAAALDSLRLPRVGGLLFVETRCPGPRGDDRSPRVLRRRRPAHIVAGRSWFVFLASFGPGQRRMRHRSLRRQCAGAAAFRPFCVPHEERLGQGLRRSSPAPDGRSVNIARSSEVCASNASSPAGE